MFSLAPLLLAAVPLDVWYVDASASCASATGSAALPFCTIAEAIAAATDGDTIRIAPGTYAEHLVVEEDLVLVGTAGREGTAVDGGSPPAGAIPVTVGSGVTATLRGLTLENASNVCVWAMEDATLSIESCRIRGNTNASIFAYGAGLYAYRADVTLVDTLVLDNVCDPAPSVENASFGAGICAIEGTLTLERCEVTGNHNLGLESTNGGGIFSSGEMIVRDSTIEGNTVSGTPGGGGGLICSGTLILERTVIRDNQATLGGGVRSGGPATLEDVELSGNQAGGEGSAVWARSTLAVRNATIVGDASSSLVWIESFLGTPSALAMESSVVRGPGTAPVVQGDAASLAASSVSHSNLERGWSGAGTGNLDAPPQFVDAAGGDFRLQAGSPCVDAGDPLFTSAGQDAGGYGRLMDGDLDRVLRVDMGAYERTNVELAVSGAPVPGGSMTFDLTGDPAITATWLAISPAPTEGLLLSRFGSLFFDPTQPFTTLALGPLPASTTLTVPPSLPPETPILFQAIGLASGGGGKRPGNLSNPVGATVR